MQQIEAAPEEEKLMQEAIQEAGRLLYESDSASAAVVETVQSATEPGQGVGVAAAEVVIAVDQKMDLPEDFIIPMLEAVLPLVAEMAEAAGVEGSEESADGALVHAIKEIAAEYEIDPAQLQELMAEVGPDEAMQHAQKFEKHMTGGQGVPQMA